MKKAEKQGQNIIVYNIKEELDKEKLIESLGSQNETLQGAYLKEEFRMKNREATLILSLDLESFNKVAKLVKYT